MPRKIELLSPARDAVCGIEAIRHGADAVYIGGPAFGARSAAGNSVQEIARLCEEAHLYSCRVYVTMNTILTDNELLEAERLVRELYEVGVDALIVQDLAFLRLDLPPIALHASTQMDNRSVEKAKWLDSLGFSQLVLARELSLDQIAAVHKATDLPLEVFVHGALCVSYSGQCYASQYCFHRSANRGCCAQFCRLAFDLVDGDGQVLIHDKHLLSLRDMNRSKDLESLLDAGVSSFKIEGRLKDISYVKNVTAYYRLLLDDILERRPADYVRSSYGASTYQFSPCLVKSFNRGFTDYYLHGRKGNEYNFDTPKAVGEMVGAVQQMGPRSFSISGKIMLNAGDGLCYYDNNGELHGFRVNKVEKGKVFPYPVPRLRTGTQLYRNYDAAFEKTLAKPSAERRLAIKMSLEEISGGYRLALSAEGGGEAVVQINTEKVAALKPQAAYIRQQLSKLGETPFLLVKADVQTDGERFIPASQLTWLRRQGCEKLLASCKKQLRRELRRAPKPYTAEAPVPHDYRANVANSKAAEVYRSMGIHDVMPAYELNAPEGAVIMFCRHCLLYALGACQRLEHPQKLHMPLSLRLPDGRVFPLRFDCRKCQMLVYAPTSR